MVPNSTGIFPMGMKTTSSNDVQRLQTSHACAWGRRSRSGSCWTGPPPGANRTKVGPRRPRFEVFMRWLKTWIPK